MDELARPDGFPPASFIQEDCILGGLWDIMDVPSASHVLILTNKQWVHRLPPQLGGMEGSYAIDIGEQFNDLSEALTLGLDFMKDALNAGGTILVVCGDNKGCSTAGPLVVAAFLADRMGGLTSGISAVQAARPFALLDPEIAVVEQLASWDESSNAGPSNIAEIKLQLGLEEEPRNSGRQAPTVAQNAPAELSDEVCALFGAMPELSSRRFDTRTI